MLRGARQVGKTWLVRDLASRHGRELIEINLEREPAAAKLFASNDPRRILADIGLDLGRAADPARSLLFLDEIQSAPELLAKLRWFAEDLAELPVVAAGSLLEFALADHSFSMPVGRIGYRHIEPLGFVEYLHAHGQEDLVDRLAAWTPGRALDDVAHTAGTRWWQRYLQVGGMPAAVAEDVRSGDARACRTLQRELVATFRDDFAKYAGRIDRRILDAVLSTVAASVGRKFVFTRAGEGVKQHHARRAVELLAAAKLCHVVRHTAGNGLPLAAEAKDNYFKILLLDVGLLHALLRTPAGTTFPSLAGLAPQVRGQMVEQAVGQELRLLDDATGDGPQLFYWHREGGRPGEIDYLIQIAGRILPLEIKSGAAGAMKSLHQFMADKKLGLAARGDDNPPSLQTVSVRTTQGDAAEYRLLSLPGYLLWRLPDVLGAGVLAETVHLRV